MVQSETRLPLHALFEEQVRRTPQTVALFEGDNAISFAELDARASRVARSLWTRGIHAGCTVGLHLERSTTWVVGVLGILKANAAVMPLPPSYPPGRLREILAHARLDAVIDDAGTPLDRSLTERVLNLAALSSESDAADDPVAGDPDQPAFVLCSSGSTGTPKMIVRSHRSFLHRLQWTWRKHPYAANEICCQKAYATTTHTIYELFEPLLRGIPVIIVPDRHARDLEAFWDTIRSRHVSRLLIVPSALQASLDMPGFTPPALNVVVLMGEYVSPELARRALEAFPTRTRIYSIYGSTEASSTLVCDLRESYRPGTELPLGEPIAETVRPLVLGPGLQHVTPGEVGRLFISGPALFTEYFRNPEQTAAALITQAGNGDRLYDTDDQVRYMADGSLQFVGRADDTVKIRGFRVDLREVEQVLLSHPGVHRAVVIPAGDESGSARLVAFVSPVTVEHGALFETLRDRLPAYMVPSALTTIDSFPLTASGKLDRLRLLQENPTHAAAAGPERAATETERRVSAAWEAVLQHRGFGLNSTFFEVGGTSLTVFSLVHRLRTAFSLERTELPEQTAYRFPTIETLAACIDRIRSGQPVRPEGSAPILVTLRSGTDAGRAPFFVVASAGGTLGAYRKFVDALTTAREVVGVRDPFNWGDRDLSEGFRRWVDRYVDAIRQRQPRGPYYIGAYSSAGAFGYEIAYRLRREGEIVGILVLIDPLALDRGSRRRYGWWALRATWARPPLRTLVRLAGWLRVPAQWLLGARRPLRDGDSTAPLGEEFRQLAASATRDAHHLKVFSALLELNTGLPLALDDAAFSGVAPEAYMGILRSRVADLMPDIDPSSMERIAMQYAVQVRAQHAYELRTYDGPVLLVEPATRYTGLLKAHLRPHVRNLRVRAIELGEPSQRTRAITEQFGALEAHYRSMRDDRFVEGLAREVDPLLE